MTSTDGALRREFGFGDAFQATFRAVGANFPAMFMLAVLLFGLPSLIVQVARILILGTAIPNPATVFTGTSGLLVLIGMVVGLVTGVLLQGSLSRIVVIYLNGGKASAGESLAAVAPLVLPLIGIGLLSAIGIGIGLIVLIIPGLFLWIVWSLAGPIEVIERKGVIGSLRRSFSLTEGRRWMILGVILVIAIVGAIINAIILGIFGAIMGAVSPGIALTMTGILVSTVLSVLLSSITTVFTSSAVATLYAGIRQSKEGATPQSLAAVFD
jgi:hypothetical protein